jgi:hypothetical protein
LANDRPGSEKNCAKQSSSTVRQPELSYSKLRFKEEHHRSIAYAGKHYASGNVPRQTAFIACSAIDKVTGHLIAMQPTDFLEKDFRL